MYLWIFQISFWFHFWFHPIVIGKLFLIISIFENLLRLVLLPNRESLLCIMFVPCALKKNEWIKPEPVESHNVFCDLASEIIFHHLCLILWATQANLTQFGKDFINAWISGVGIICWSLTTTVFSLVPSDLQLTHVKDTLSPFWGHQKFYPITASAQRPESLHYLDGPGVNEASRMFLKYISFPAEDLWSKEITCLLPTPNVQWWDSCGTVAIDVPVQKRKKWEAYRSHKVIAVLRVSRAPVGSSLSRTKNLGIIPPNPWLHFLGPSVYPLSYPSFMKCKHVFRFVAFSGVLKTSLHYVCVFSFQSKLLLFLPIHFS